MTWRTGALAWLLLLPLSHAVAQVDVSGSAALQSAYRYRGQSWGAGPVPQLTLNVDHDSGLYAGGFASGLAGADERGDLLQTYGGYARRLASGVGWEAGCSHTGYTRAHGYDFLECYGGLSGERLSARLYYAPRYLGYAARTLYAELNLFYPVALGFNVVGHAGLLHHFGDGVWPGVPARSRYDARLGVSIPFGNWTAQLAREQGQADAARYAGEPVRSSGAWLLSATFSF